MVTRVGAATPGVNTATLPAHAAGDLIVAFAFRDGNTTAPSVPTGQNWVTLGSAGATACSATLVAKIAQGSSEGVGTFTNATSVVAVVWRAASGKKLGLGLFSAASGSGTTVTYPANPLAGPTSWVGAMAGHCSTNTTLETPPTGMTNVSDYVNTTNESVAHDTNGTATAWNSTNVSVGGTSSGWISVTFEIREYTDVLTRFKAARDHATDNALVIGIGHSIVAGAGSTMSGTLGANSISGSYLSQTAAAFTKCLARSSNSSFMGDENSQASGYSPDAYNTNLALNGWTASEPTLASVGVGHFTPASASYLAWTPNVAFDRIQVFYDRYPGSPTYTVNVDGGASLGTLNMNAAATLASETFSVTDATHTVRFVAAATGGYIAGAIAWRSSVKQLTFLNAAWVGGLTSDYLSTVNAWAPLNALRSIGTVAATIVQFDVLEITHAVPLLTFLYNLATMVSDRLKYGDVVLISTCYMNPTIVPEATQRTYHDIAAQLAGLMGCAYIRGTDQPGLSSFASGNALGYYDPDGLHMPAIGYGVAYKTPLLALLDT